VSSTVALATAVTVATASRDAFMTLLFGVGKHYRVYRRGERRPPRVDFSVRDAPHERDAVCAVLERVLLANCRVIGYGPKRCSMPVRHWALMAAVES
jgi:hypothetical protein